MEEGYKKQNTYKILQNSWNTGGGQEVLTGSITVSPLVADQYDFAMTDDPVLLQERKNTAEELYKIFEQSEWFEKYGTMARKVEKNDILPLFYALKAGLDKVKKVSAYETILAICEFADLPYEYVWNNVASVQLKSEVYEDFYKNLGKKKVMDTYNQVKLF